MSRPRFFADHDDNEQIIDGLLRREPLVEIVRARDVGLADRADNGVLEFAAANEQILVSHDVNTMPAAAFRRLEFGEAMTGLLMAHQSTPVGRIVEDLVLIWSASEAEEWDGQAVFLPFD